MYSPRDLDWARRVVDFLGIEVAIVFLFLQYLAAKDNYPRLHDVLGYVGTGLSIVIILGLSRR